RQLTMKLSTLLTFWSLGLFVYLPACGSQVAEPPDDPNLSQSGGASTASGGNVNSSGGSSSGGANSGGPASGSASSSGGAASGGATSSGGAGDVGSGGGESETELGSGLMEGKDESSERYQTAHVRRSGVNYVLTTNGWGPGFQSHTIAWEGTSFLVKSTEGSSGAMGQPASYPTVFCGRYSVMRSEERRVGKECRCGRDRDDE